MNVHRQVRLLLLVCGLISTVAVNASAQSGGGNNVKYSSSFSINFPPSATGICQQTLSFSTASSTKLLIITSTVHDNDAGCTVSNVYLNPVVKAPGVPDWEPLNYLQFRTPSTAICTDTRTARWTMDVAAQGMSGKALTICMEGQSFPSLNFGVDTTAELVPK